MKMDLEVIPTGKTTATVIWTQEQVDAVRGAPGRGRVMLAITYKGRTFRTSVSVYRGEWMMVVNQEMREGGLAPGGTYRADVTVDAEERVVEVPDDFAKAMKAAGVRKTFDALSYTHRKEHVRAISEAKKPETRARRIESAIAKLEGR